MVIVLRRKKKNFLMALFEYLFYELYRVSQLVCGLNPMIFFFSLPHLGIHHLLPVVVLHTHQRSALAFGCPFLAARFSSVRLILIETDVDLT